MRTIARTAIGALLVIGLTAGPAAWATAAAAQPSTVAIVIMEDQDACSHTDGLLGVCAVLPTGCRI